MSDETVDDLRRQLAAASDRERGLSGRLEAAWSERDDLRRQLAEAQAERDEARRNYQFMVDRAADEKLDGYRALGEKVATAETERDAALGRAEREEAVAGQLADACVYEVGEEAWECAACGSQAFLRQDITHDDGCPVAAHERLKAGEPLGAQLLREARESGVFDGFDFTAAIKQLEEDRGDG